MSNIAELAKTPLDKLDRDRADKIVVSKTAGGMSFASMLEVMEFAKLMSIAGAAVPRDLRNNAGLCLAVVTQAIEWQMMPFQVASKSYVVNDRLAFESQLIHAVVEARAPIRRRLECDYQGEGGDRQCTVTGEFLDGARRTYTSPKIKDIKVKNSPLWSADPDQQLWYYASRSWARKWCPDVILGIYAGEELRDNPDLGREQEAGLHARLVAGNVDREQGHNHESIAQQLGEIHGDVLDTADDQPAEPVAADEVQVPAKKRGKKAKKAESEPEQPAQAPATPRNSREWAAYCAAWLKAADSAVDIGTRWKAERALRNTCGVTAEDRQPVEAFMRERIAELGGE